MTAPVIGLRDTCRRLRELEEAIAAQRRRVAEETGQRGAQSARAQTARARLARLLSELDEFLGAAEMGVARGV